MHITADQSIAGYPAKKVRDFLRGRQLGAIFNEVALGELALKPKAARDLLKELVVIGLIKEYGKCDGDLYFQLTCHGQNFANAPASKPIHRKTAERVLAEFMQRMERVNATSEYLYRVDTAILFGSMLSDVERLGDVDVAVNLEPKVREEAAFEEWQMERRRAAQIGGRSFSSYVAWLYYPREEVYRQLKARTLSLSLYELSNVKNLPDLSYRILLGDPEQLAALIPTGRAA
jgi:predicted nucleotidyltransferase